MSRARKVIAEITLPLVAGDNHTMVRSHLNIDDEEIERNMTLANVLSANYTGNNWRSIR